MLRQPKQTARHSSGALRLAALLACTVAVSAAFALGMRVQPGGALLQGWPVGERRELPVPLMVFNDGEEPHKVTASACKPSEIGGTPPRGYAEIPDPAWLTIEPAEIQIPAKGQAAMKMFLNVPEEEKYLNAHWSVSLAVRSSPAAGQKIGLALYPRFEIETAAKETGVAPNADLAITPSFFSLDDLGAGGKSERIRLKVWNETRKVQHCTARILGKPAEGEKSAIRLSHGQVWIPETSWISLDTPAFNVAPGGPYELPLEVAVPLKDAYRGREWEVVLLITSADDLAAFARLRIGGPEK